MLQKQRGFVVALKEEKREREDGFVHQDSEHLSMMGECACVCVCEKREKGMEGTGRPKEISPSLYISPPLVL